MDHPEACHGGKSLLQLHSTEVETNMKSYLASTLVVKLLGLGLFLG